MYYNEYGYSYFVWYSNSSRTFKILYPDNNYQEKTYTINQSNINILGPYKNYIVYMTYGTTNYCYALDINTGNVTTIFSVLQEHSGRTSAMSKEGTIAFVQYFKNNYMKVYAYDFASRKVLYNNSYYMQSNIYSGYSYSISISVSGSNVAVAERRSKDSSSYYNYSYIDPTGRRFGSIEGQSTSSNRWRYTTDFEATKTGLVVVNVDEDREDDEFFSDIYIYINGTQYKKDYDGEAHLHEFNRYVGVPGVVLVGNADDNAGIMYNSPNYSSVENIIYSKDNVIYGYSYKKKLVKYTVNETSRTIGAKTIGLSYITDGAYDPIKNLVYAEIVMPNTYTIYIYDQDFNKYGSSNQFRLPTVSTETKNFIETEYGLNYFELKFADDAVMSAIQNLDSSPPIVYLDIPNYTNTANLQLNITATDNKDISSNLLMRISVNGGQSYSNWINYVTTYNATLSNPDGEKQIIVQVKDTSGNIGIGMSKIMYGNQSNAPPSTISSYNPKIKSGSVYINPITINGKTVYPVATQDLTIEMDAKNVKEIKINDNVNVIRDGSYENATISNSKIIKQLKLNDFDGVQTLYIQLKNQYGAETSPMEINFLLDRESPQVYVSSANKQTITTSPTIILTINVKDNTVSPLYYSVDKGSHWSGITDGSNITYSGLSLKYNKVEVWVKDASGNIGKGYYEVFKK